MIALLAALASLSCPADQELRVDLKQWAERMRAADGAALNSLLAELRLQPPADVVELLQRDGRLPHDLRAGDLPECGAEPVRVAGVDVFTAPLSGPGVRDQVVQVRLEVCTIDQNGAAVSLRIQVLAPLPNGAFCAIGADLSTDMLLSDFRCGEHLDRALPRTFSFKRVTDKDRRTIEVRDVTGFCDDGGQAQSFWNVEGSSLRRIFEAQLNRSSWAPHSNQFERSATLELRGRYPKELVLRAREALSGCHGEDHFCFSNASTDVRRFRFDGTQYVAVPQARRKGE